VDLCRSAALILAVVPFDQVGVDFGHGAKAGQFAGPNRALQRAGKDLDKGQSPQPLTESAGVALAAFGQRQIGAAGVLAGETPGSLAMPRQVNDRKGFAHATHPDL
jgi:hypothetical protein